MRRLAAWLGAEAGDAGPLALLALRAVIVSVAAVAGMAYQCALFLDAFDASMLLWQFTAMAAASVVLAVPYARAQRVWGEAWADRCVLGLLAAGMIVVAARPDLVAAPVAVFAFSIWVQLVGLFGNVGVWDAAVQIFPSRKARVLLPIVGAAATLGSSLGGQVARVLAHRFGNDGVLPALAGLTAAAAMLSGFPRTRDEAAGRAGGGKAGMARQAVTLLTRNRLALYVTLLVLLSTPLFLTVDFTFKKVLQAHYSADRMSMFLGGFYFWTNLGVLVLQTLVMGRLMTRLGVAWIAAVTPSIVVAALVGLALLPALGMVVVLAVGAGVTRYTFFQNSRNQLLTPLSPREKGIANTLNRAVVVPVGAAAGSLLLLPARDAGVVALALFSVGAAAVTLWMALRASRAYRAELVASLRRRVLTLGHGEHGLAAPDATALAFIREGIRSGEIEDAVFGTTLLAQWGALEAADARTLFERGSTAARIEAVRLARHLERDEAPDLLVTVLERADEAAVLGEACAVAAGMPLGRLVPVARGLAARDSSVLRRGAGLWVLSLAREPVDQGTATDVLRSLWETDDARGFAVDVAAAVGGPAGERFLRAALDSGDRGARNETLEAVGRGRIAALYPDLDRALDDHRSRASALEGIILAGRLAETARRRLPDASSAALAPVLARALAGSAEPDAPAAVLDVLRAGRTWHRWLLLRSLERCGTSPVAAAVLSAGLERPLAEGLVALSSARGRAVRPATRLELAAEWSFARGAVFSWLRLSDPRSGAKLSELEASLRSGDARQANAAMELLEEFCKGGREWLVACLESAPEGAARAAAALGLDVRDPERARPATRCPDAFVASVVEALEKEAEPMESAGLDPKLLGKGMNLRHSGFFSHLATEVVLDIARRGEEVYLQAGEVLFREGDPPDGLYFVMDGKLEVLIRGDKINELGPGAVLGEIALLDAGPRSATVGAETATELLRFSPGLFDEILDEYPDVARGVIGTLVEHIRRQCRAGDGGAAA